MACCPDKVVAEHIPRDVPSLFAGLRDYNAFTGRQSVCFNHDRRMKERQSVGHILFLQANGVMCCRHLMALHKFLSECLAGFQQLRFEISRVEFDTRRAEDSQPASLKFIDDAQGEREFRSDDREISLKPKGRVNELFDAVEIAAQASSVPRNAPIARNAKDLINARRLPEFPNQGMFTPTTADDQDSHVLPQKTGMS